MLTKNNAKERCRTCLCKLLKDEDHSDTELVGASSDPNKFVDISLYTELKEMVEQFLTIECEENVCNDQSYPQYICMECLKQLQMFETFRNKALDSAKKLYTVFSGNCNVPKVELNDDGLEFKGTAEDQFKDCVKDDIFNLLLKDSLMETEAIILDSSGNNNEFSSTDPDPFQNTQKGESEKKSRTRRVKGKNDTLPKNKIIPTRKTKKCSAVVKTESPLDIKNVPIEKENDSNDDFVCHDSTFQDPNDNEVLSKIIHAEATSKEKNKSKKMNTNSLDNKLSISEISNELLQTEVFEKEETNLTSKGNEALLQGLNGDSDVTSSSESDFNANDRNPPKQIKREKKKRHYILNSGRKKGLANKYKCDQCQHKFGHKLTLEAHVRKVHEGQKKAFKCQLCDKAYSFIGGLSTHIRDVHERKQDSYDCNVPGCDKKYSNLITLQRHVRFKHLNMENTHQYVCEQCGATFKQSSNLRYHMKTRHPTEEDLKRKELLPKDRLECEDCKKSFHSQYTLKYHKLRVHADEKKFECKICGRRVAKQFMLDSHMLVHSDQKVACKFCGREFVRKYQVEAHIRAVHQKLKPFQCPHCSESFASRKTLRHHIYIHTGEKPYVCDICGQAYRQPTCLKNHRKIHNK